jgi:two-component system alkaline phosphatase synthesis response regulator PhoP
MIFYVEDDRSIRELVVYTLKNTGYQAVGFENGEQFFEELKKTKPDLILLDIMLPGDDGIKILKKLRSDITTKIIPVIMVTAKGTEYDKVIGLDMGADDYISKPFGMMELISRIGAVLRRTRNLNEVEEYCYNSLKLNTRMHLVTVNGTVVDLTLKEFELLKVLMKNMGTVLTRDMLLENIWGYEFDGETRTVDVHIRTLRQKIGDNGNIIETVRGVGYRIGGQNK